MKLKRISFLLLVGLAACKSSKQGQDSKCLQAKIGFFEKEACASGASVKEYTFQGKTVYAFNHGSCGADRTTEVIDSDCKGLGLLGGIAGVTKINGEEFSKAVFVKTVWENQQADNK